MKTGNSCTGCSACVQSCPRKLIDMREDSQGFLYPCFARDEKCKVCSVCDKTCPTMSTLSENTVYAYAAWAKDDAIVVSSSSGGLFQLLARYVISKGGVVFGAVFDENFKVMHKSAQTLEQISDLLGSKYVQSDIGNTYREAKEFLRQGRLVLYSGVPCQLAGLHSFLGDKLANTGNLIRVDVFCKGSPSPSNHRFVFMQPISMCRPGKNSKNSSAKWMSVILWAYLGLQRNYKQ